jgi:acyl-[acyl carrier protein]--UDP-N-acetylglucosamine O-acyltransferase
MIDPTAQLHSHALVDDGAQIGARTRVWAFAHVLPGAIVGADCNLCDHTFVEGGACVGDRVTLKCGVFLWDGFTAEDDVFIGPAAVFTNDVRPRSKQYLAEVAKTHLCRGASIGGGAVVVPGRRIGAWSMVGAGAVVTRDVADHALVVGNPARRVGWVCRCGQRLEPEGGAAVTCACGASFQLAPGGEALVEVVT